MIYLDNAATSFKKPQTVIDAVSSAMTQAGNAGRGSSHASMAAARIVFQARAKLNQLINGIDPRQVAFCHNATEALNTAIQGSFRAGDHVITTVTEHNSVLRPLYAMEAAGLELTILDLDAEGRLTPEAVQRAVRDNTKGLVINHASNVTGNINPIKDIVAAIQSPDIRVILDASQTLGAIPLDVQDLGVDIVCFTGHKSLLGPQGTGGLYLRPGCHISPLKRGGTGFDTFNHQQPEDMPTLLESGTLNSHGLAGLEASLTYLLDYGVARIQAEERELLDSFYGQLQGIKSVIIYGTFDPDQARVPIISLNIGDLDSARISDYLLDEFAIMTRAGGHCAPLMHKHFDTVDQGMVRFSLSHFTTKDEINQAVTAIKQLAEHA